MSIESNSSNISGRQTDRGRAEYVNRGKVTVRDLLGGILPKRPDLIAAANKYEELADLPLEVAAAQDTAKGDTYYLAYPRPFNPHEVNATMYFAAPDSSFGLDLEDIVMDWNDIYNPENRERLQAHRRMPGWEEYERGKAQMKGVLERMLKARRGKKPVDKTDILRPVVKVKKNDRGELKWMLDGTYTDRRNDPYLGLLYVAAYSPEVTSEWGARRTYAHISSNGQSMGATQVLPLALRFQDTLLESDLIRNLVGHIEAVSR